MLLLNSSSSLIRYELKKLFDFFLEFDVMTATKVLSSKSQNCDCSDGAHLSVISDGNQVNVWMRLEHNLAAI
jgi:hypothetical protein